MSKPNVRFLALLRGINVGGKNIIKMADLRSCFSDLGFNEVRTYIQSGNVLFRSDMTSVRSLTAKIESALKESFSYEANVVVLSFTKFRSAVAAAPEGWGGDDAYKHDALFTLSSTTPKKVVSQLPTSNPEIETVATGPGVVFVSTEKERRTKSMLMKLPKEPVYQQVTIRNHNTVFKLLALFEEI